MRRKDCIAIGSVLALLSAAPAGVRAQDAALLLGEYESTTLIVVHGDSVSARRGAGLVVPRPGGWWRVGVDAPSIRYPAQRADTDTTPDSLREPTMSAHGEELGHDACFAHIVWAAPLGTMPTLPDGDCAEGADPAGEYSFTFVSPVVLTMYAGITTDYAYNFRRGTIVATLDSAAHHPLVSIGGPGNVEDPPDPDPAFGVGRGDARWAREGARCNFEYNRDLRQSDEADSSEYDYRGTLIVRSPGRWRLDRYYANISYVGRGAEDDCILRIPVPERLTGWDRLTVQMTAIRTRVPKAIDAFTSPNGAVAVVLDSTATHVFRITQGALGPELGVIGPRPNWVRSVEMTTMSQWATGAAAGRWEMELAAVLPAVVEVRRGTATPARDRR